MEQIVLVFDFAYRFNGAENGFSRLAPSQQQQMRCLSGSNPARPPWERPRPEGQFNCDHLPEGIGSNLGQVTPGLIISFS